MPRVNAPKLAIASLFILAACGTARHREPVSMDASPVEVQPEVLAVMIAATRAVIDSARSYGTVPATYCLSVGPTNAVPKDPPAGLVTGLADITPPVTSLSHCDRDPGTDRLWLEGTDQAAWWIFVTVPKLRDSTGFIGAGYSKEALNAAGYDCALVRVGAAWRLGRCRLSFVS
jgi:hypothetical protein